MTQANEQRVALVTGGNRGIGKAIVAALLEDDWTVDFCGRSEDSLRSTQSEFAEDYGERVDARICDVRDQEQVQALVDWVIDRRGRLDLLVNNAGIGYFAPVDEMSGEDWRRVVETNLNGSFYGIHAVAPHMKRQGAGWIVNIASLASRNPFAGGAAYNASKFGLLGLSDAAMLDLRHQGVRVTAILPGSVDTEFHAGRHASGREWMLSPDDVGRAVVDLVRYPDRAIPSRLEIRPSHPPKS